MEKEPKIVIEFRDVDKSFGRQKVLDKVNLSIYEGKTTVIVGASGQGKSVTLKHMLGLMWADRGQVLINGQDIAKMKKRTLHDTRSRFGVLFQGGALFDSMTVFENVAMPLRERTKFSEKDIRMRVLEKLDMVELKDIENKFPGQLSGGMKKRVGLARALVLNPENVFLDEPTTGLDVKMSKEIYRIIHRLHEELGFTGVIVSHDAPKIFKLADYIALMAEARIQDCLAPEEFQLSSNPYIRDFVKETMGDIFVSGEKVQ